MFTHQIFNWVVYCANGKQALCSFFASLGNKRYLLGLKGLLKITY